MIPAEFLKLIEKSFNEEDKQVLVASLHQDSRIYHALEKIPDLDELQKERFTKIENWAPLYFALILKDKKYWKTDLSSLRVNDLFAMGDEISMDQLEATNFYANDVLDLVTAASFAINLFFTAKKRTWQEVNKYFFHDFDFNRNAGLIAACLLGLFSSPDDFVSSLLDEDAGIETRKMVCYALFCNVQPEELLHKRLRTILTGLDEESRIELLQFFFQIGRGETARALIPGEIFEEVREAKEKNSLTLRNELDILQRRNYEADLHHIMGDKKASAENLELMLQTCKIIELEVLEKIQQLTIEEKPQDKIVEPTVIPIKQSYDWKKVPQFKSTAALEQPAYDDLERDITYLEESMVEFPSDATSHIVAADFYSELGDFSRSINHLRLAHILDPKNDAILVRLINLYKANNQWQEVSDLSRAISREDETIPNLETFFQELHLSLKNGEKEISRQKLAGFLLEAQINSAEDLQKIAVLFTEMDDSENAIQYYERSISAGCTDFHAWIDLYGCLKKQQQDEKAKEILNEAIDFFKERKGFYATLTNGLLKAGEEDQGLAYLEKIKIDESEPAVLAGIIKYLQEHKHYQYAYEMAINAEQRYPLSATLGVEVAHVLMENNESKHAQKNLKWIQNEKQDDIYFLLLQILSNFSSSFSRFPLDTKLPDDAELLHGKIQLLPQDSLWRDLINAEMHLLKNENVQAVEAYKELILNNSMGKNRPELWRAQVGLSKALMRTGQLETAVTLLREALREKNDSLALYELLINVYQDKNLIDEAVETAREGYITCRKDVNIIHWYIDQLTKLGKMDEIRTYFDEEQKYLQSSPSFLKEKLLFENKYGSVSQTKRMLDDLLSLDNLSVQDLLQIIEISEQVKYSEISIKSIHKLKKTSLPETEQKFIEVCILWNKGDHRTARQYIEDLPTSQNWDGITNSIKYMVDYTENDYLPSLSEINQVLVDSKDTQLYLDMLSGTIQNILPPGWKAAIRSTQIWVEMAIQNIIYGQFNENEIEQQLEILERYADDATSRSVLAVCDWLIHGNSERIDWMEILGLVDRIEQFEQKASLEGIILCILMQDGNEIAVVDKLNQVEQPFYSNKMLLLVKARILQKNGSTTEAQVYYHQAVELENENQGQQTAEGNVLEQLTEFPFWKAECAYELGLWQSASTEYFACLPRIQKMRYVSNWSLKRILELAWKEWSFRKIGIIQNLPDILNTKELQQIRPYLDNLEQNEKTGFEKIVSYLQGEEVYFTENESGGDFTSRFSAFIKTIQENDLEAMMELVSSDSYRYDLALSAITLVPPEKTADLLPVIQNGIFHEKNNAYLYVGLARILQIQDEPRLAIDALESALDSLQDEPILQTQLASLYEEEGEIKKAVVHSEQAIRIDPHNVEIIKTHLLNLITIKDYRTAIEQFEMNKAVFNQDEMVTRKMVDVYYQNEQYRKALDMMKIVGKDPQKDIELILIQAKIARKVGSIPKAIQLIRIAYELDPKSPEVIIELAKIKTLQENEEFGLEIVEKALESNIQSDDLILEKVAYLEKVRSEKRAVDFLEAYLEKVESPAYTILNRYGQLQKDRNESEKALIAFERSLQKNDMQPDIHEQVGELYVRNGSLDLAVDHFDKAVKQDPSQMRAYLQLADVFLKRREEKRAEKILVNAMQNCEEHYLIYEKVAQVYNQLGDVDQSEQFLRKAAEKNPGDEKLREKLGILIANRIFEKK
ncbi:MAG TPA: hypothetical protein DCK95_02115 [Anaerolineaceae bacterium]|uniref:TPR domain protein, putative n=1 Tax=Anaerolinea thermophila TaxID=167964 RepID=A0A117LH14_9CHLR|nr:MAG: TPR domain protein, putative [Anaerolinea thermophila]HAF61102.1 hypothetical protein [Anaerolineaceae bacterium]